MKNYLFIINPEAGKGRGKFLFEQISSHLKNIKLDSQIVKTNYVGHATEIAKDYSENFNHIIAVGGDGTLNEVINGVQASGNSVGVGVFPIGTGNDFVKNFKISDNIPELINQLSENNFTTEKCDVGRLKFKIEGSEHQFTRMFINTIGIGFDAMVAHYNSKVKYATGILSYIVSVLKSLKKFSYFHFTATIDSVFYEGYNTLISIGNGISSGGGFYLTPDATTNDSFFDLCSIKKVNKILLLKKLPMAFTRNIGNLPEVKLLKFQNAQLILKEPTYFHIDGEFITNKLTEIEITNLAQKANIINFGAVQC